MDSPVIQLNGISKKYGDFTAVNNLDLSINKGEIFGLLGPNGAGKSTTILMLMGLTEPSSGSVSVCGINSTSKPIAVKKKVGYLPEDVGFYDDLSGLDNLIYTARLNGFDYSTAKEKAGELLERVGLGNDKNKKTGKYSKGMRQRLGLADVLIKNPEVIILDEPTTGIDPKGVMELLSLIKKLSVEQNITVLFSSHNLHQVQQVCDRVGIFVSGKLLAEGNIKELSQKLFTHGMYLIELAIDSGDKSPIGSEELEKLLAPIEGIQKVSADNTLFQIECSSDISSSIAKTVIEADYELNFLSKKEYGLDAIYNRYFEGGLSDD
ncbi:ABC transporter ATP-binding protein [Carboxylicivirga sp. A043]|uniref:ABC transporter ATP-binding protein n=1 Tax=Plebeiibacterium marinum TaxID=2992111 RepID=A0AAE3SKX8_9BACT|nr:MULTISPECIES: ABC transporter ATP-binding protein [Marinilabiliaceae]MCU4156841.1 ABC transporter ATP-binding protein [Carboxylicivirga sp. A043]MCW3807335.1 ABC transporter ATP-binding protein [Plebeiobacterium marinum]